MKHILTKGQIVCLLRQSKIIDKNACVNDFNPKLLIKYMKFLDLVVDKVIEIGLNSKP